MLLLPPFPAAGYLRPSDVTLRTDYTFGEAVVEAEALRTKGNAAFKVGCLGGAQGARSV
jgi:hypothetical protein